MTEYYIVAGFGLSFIHSLEGNPLERLAGFRPFKKSAVPGKINLEYDASCSSASLESEKMAAEALKSVYEFKFEDEDIFCQFFVSPDQSRYWFKMEDNKGGVPHFFEAHMEGRCLKVRSNWQDNQNFSMLRFSMWMAFTIVCAFNGAIAIHSSCIVRDDFGKAALFLGESGTGKSTHTRMYREAFGLDTVHLLNDDCPILKTETDGRVMVYGSPWSGKTPCYRDESYPVAGICRLSQAPENKIQRLSILGAFKAMYPSCPPALAKNDVFEDKICSTLSIILSDIRVFHLECLPDHDAARLSSKWIFEEN